MVTYNEITASGTTTLHTNIQLTDIQTYYDSAIPNFFIACDGVKIYERDTDGSFSPAIPYDNYCARLDINKVSVPGTVDVYIGQRSTTTASGAITEVVIPVMSEFSLIVAFGFALLITAVILKKPV